MDAKYWVGNLNTYDVQVSYNQLGDRLDNENDDGSEYQNTENFTINARTKEEAENLAIEELQKVFGEDLDKESGFETYANEISYAKGGATFGDGKKYYWITMDKDLIDEYIGYASRMNNMYDGEIYTQAPNKVAFETDDDRFNFTSMLENEDLDYEYLYDGEPRMNIFDKISQKNYAKGGKTKSFWDKTRDFGKKASAKAKEYGKKGVEATKQAIHEQKRKNATNVMYETLNHRKLTDKEKLSVMETMDIVDKKYAKGGGLGLKTYEIKGVDVTYSEDSYEEGEVGYFHSYMLNQSEFPYQTKFHSKKELFDTLNEFISYADFKEDDFYVDENTIQVSAIVKYQKDSDWDEFSAPTKEEIELWKQGKMKLYSAQFVFPYEVYRKEKLDFAKGGGVDFRWHNRPTERYRILGAIGKEKPMFHSAVATRSEIADRVKMAKKDFEELGYKNIEVFVTDNKEDREIYPNQYAKGGKIQVGDAVISIKDNFPHSISGMGRGQVGIVEEIIKVRADGDDGGVAIVQASNGRRVEAMIKNLETHQSLVGSYAKGGKTFDEVWGKFKTDTARSFGNPPRTDLTCYYLLHNTDTNNPMFKILKNGNQVPSEQELQSLIDDGLVMERSCSVYAKNQEAIENEILDMLSRKNIFGVKVVGYEIDGKNPMKFNDMIPYGYEQGGSVFTKGRVVLADGKGIGGNKNKTYQLRKFDYSDGSGNEGFEVIEFPTNNVMAQGTNYDDVLNSFNLFIGKFSQGGDIGDMITYSATFDLKDKKGKKIDNPMPSIQFDVSSDVTYSDAKNHAKEIFESGTHFEKGMQSEMTDFWMGEMDAEEDNRKRVEEEVVEEVEEFVPRVERSGKWDASYSVLCDELSQEYEMGGEIEFDEDRDMRGIEVGDYIDFGSKGNKYVSILDGDRLIVVDSEDEIGSSVGQYIYPSSAKRILKREDDEYSFGGGIDTSNLKLLSDEFEDVAYETWARNFGVAQIDGFNNDKDINILVTATLTDMSEATGDAQFDEKPYIWRFDTHAYPQFWSNKYAQNIKDMVGDDDINPRELSYLSDANSYGLGVPLSVVNDDQQFETEEDALEYLNSKQVKSDIDGMGIMSGYHFDRPYNRMGDDGWSLLSQQVGSDEYSFGGGVALGSIIGGYIGYKIGRGMPQKKGFDTEKRVAKKTFSAIGKGAESIGKGKVAKGKAKKMEDGGKLEDETYWDDVNSWSDYEVAEFLGINEDEVDYEYRQQAVNKLKENI